jgi:hypothetical protein
MERFLALSLTLLSGVLLCAAWSAPFEPRPFIRLMGFSLGGMVSVPTLVLCGYYIRIRAVRSASIKGAAMVSGAYATLFSVFVVAALTGSPLAYKWL